MKKLEIELIVKGRSLIMYIHHMDEGFRVKGALFKASNDIKICSNSSPDILRNVVYLLGENKGWDNTVSIFNMGSPKDAENYKKRILAALKEWSEEWEGWSQKEESQEDYYVF